LAAQDHHLAVMVTLGEDGRPQVSVVNCGLVDDPGGDGPRVALVARRGAKTRNLRRNPLATLVVRAGWEWIAVSGVADIIGREDDLDSERFRQLLRDVFHAAGGHHDDLDAYDRVMAAEGRCAVLIRPERFASNPPGAEHRGATS
jgi:PPOX class probable F420-dependent enzyme